MHKVSTIYVCLALYIERVFSYVRFNDRHICSVDIKPHELIELDGPVRVTIVSNAARLWLLYSPTNPEQLVARSKVLGSRYE